MPNIKANDILFNIEFTDSLTNIEVSLREREKINAPLGMPS
jgi:hypothetical protein